MRAVLWREGAAIVRFYIHKEPVENRRRLAGAFQA